jgi:hypothetical protein
MLKLFPIGALSIWIRRFRGRIFDHRWKILAVGAVFAAGFLLQWDGLRAVSERTPRPMHYMSYGLATLPSLVVERTNLGGLWSAGLYALFYGGIAAFGLMLWTLTRQKPLRLPETSEQSKNLFLAGAGCFLVSNLIGFNWEYRLVFLLLALPEVFALRAAHGLLFRVILASMLLLFYQTMIKRLLDGLMPLLPYKTNHFYFLADLNNIVLFYLMAFLVAKMLFPAKASAATGEHCWRQRDMA